MIRAVADINFYRPFLAAVRRVRPDFDCVLGQDVGLDGKSDEVLLEWAAVNDRVVLSIDKKTIPDEAAARMASGKVFAGAILVKPSAMFAAVVQDLILIVAATEQYEWIDRVEFIPY